MSTDATKGARGREPRGRRRPLPHGGRITRRRRQVAAGPMAGDSAHRPLRAGRKTVRRLRVRAPFAMLLSAFAITACNNEPAPTAAPAPPAHTIYTTFYPTTYFARRIAPESFEVVCPLPEDADPIIWPPSREAIAAYQKAGAIILSGAEFEKWAITAALPRSRVVDSAAAIPDGFITFQSTTRSHGAGGEHPHEGI